MATITIDPELLDRQAAAAGHAAEQSWIHLEAEIAGNVPKLMETVRAEGPYAYMTLPQVSPDGSVKLPIVGTRDGINDAYVMVRGGSDIHSTEAIVEVRGAWYTFVQAVSVAQRKDSDATLVAETAVLLPCSTDSGITGELVWLRMLGDMIGTPTAPADGGLDAVRDLKLDVLRQHNRYLKALRATDVDGILETYDDDVQGATRDYVENTGFLGGLEGKAAHGDYYRALFNLYEIEAVKLLDRVVMEWYVFAELRYDVKRKDGGGSFSFNTAEFFVPGPGGRFKVRIGHGTDLV